MSGPFVFDLNVYRAELLENGKNWGDLEKYLDYFSRELYKDKGFDSGLNDSQIKEWLNINFIYVLRKIVERKDVRAASAFDTNMLSHDKINKMGLKRQYENYMFAMNLISLSGKSGTVDYNLVEKALDEFIATGDIDIKGLKSEKSGPAAASGKSAAFSAGAANAKDKDAFSDNVARLRNLVKEIINSRDFDANLQNLPNGNLKTFLYDEHVFAEMQKAKSGRQQD